jgi:hypothetical protein
MAQFDSLIIFSLVWSLLVVLFLHYNFLLFTVIPNFIGAKKFREKKLNFSNFNFFSFASTIEVNKVL